MAYSTLKQACARLGLHPNSLRKYADNGTIKSIRTPGGQRRFEVDEYLRQNTGAATVCYCRVSSAKQRDDLQRQVQRMQALYPSAQIIQDIGSGLNFKRKGLRSLLERLLQADQLTVVVSHKDRLARFGFDLIEQLVHHHGGRIVVLDPYVSTSPQSELTADLLAILHHFACKMHGARSHQGKKTADLSGSKATQDLPAMVRDFQIRLQRNGQPSEFDRSAEPLDGGCQDHPAPDARVGKGGPLSNQENCD